MLGVWRQYNGDSLYLLAFAVSLGLTIWQGKKKGAGIWKQIVMAVFLALLFVFNGAAYRVAGKLTKDIKTYYRFFWMLPILPVTAYQLTLALTSRQKKNVFLGSVALVLCLCIGANCFINRTNLKKPENIYGIAQDAIDAADAIMEDWEQEERQPVVAFDIYLEYQVRTYEPRICWGISRKAYLYQAEHGYDGKKYQKEQPVIAAVNEGIQNNSRKLARCIKKIGIDYLVIQSAFDMDDYLSVISICPVAHSGNYTVYKVE